MLRSAPGDLPVGTAANVGTSRTSSVALLPHLLVARDRRTFRQAASAPGLTYLLFDIGVERTAASHAALLLALDSPATLVLAVAFLRERIDLPLLASLVFAVGGSVLITWRADGQHSSLLGDVLVIASACSAAAFAVLARHIAAIGEPVTVTAVQMLGALFIVGPVVGTSFARGHSRIADADGAHLAVAIAVGVLGGVIPFLLFNRALTQVTASRAGLIGVLVPVIGAGASALLLGERITRLAALGGIVAVAGATLAARREDNSAGTTGTAEIRSIAAAPSSRVRLRDLAAEQRKAS
jgi:O-acetylserine/cysteine efflux transporter